MVGSALRVAGRAVLNFRLWDQATVAGRSQKQIDAPTSGRWNIRDRGLINDRVSQSHLKEDRGPVRRHSVCLAGQTGNVDRKSVV